MQSLIEYTDSKPKSALLVLRRCDKPPQQALDCQTQKQQNKQKNQHIPYQSIKYLLLKNVMCYRRENGANLDHHCRHLPHKNNQPRQNRIF